MGLGLAHLPPGEGQESQLAPPGRYSWTSCLPGAGTLDLWDTRVGWLAGQPRRG